LLDDLSPSDFAPGPGSPPTGPPAQPNTDERDAENGEDQDT
jgi:hypothetical protein